MPDEKAIRDLIRLSYECSVDARQWRRFLPAFAGAVNAPAATMPVLDARNCRGTVTGDKAERMIGLWHVPTCFTEDKF